MKPGKPIQPVGKGNGGKLLYRGGEVRQLLAAKDSEIAELQTIITYQNTEMQALATVAHNVRDVLAKISADSGRFLDAKFPKPEATQHPIAEGAVQHVPDVAAPAPPFVPAGLALLTDDSGDDLPALVRDDFADAEVSAAADAGAEPPRGVLRGTPEDARDMPATQRLHP